MCPSNLFSLKDYMIDTPFISQLMNFNMDINEYFKGKIKIDERYNIFLSESYLIKKYPKTFIIFGSTDPIRDESYKLADFLM
jgi:hypothetical protein